jgi:hypothetical protein
MRYCPRRHLMQNTIERSFASQTGSSSESISGSTSILTCATTSQRYQRKNEKYTSPNIGQCSKHFCCRGRMAAPILRVPLLTTLMKVFNSILTYDPEQILQWASKTCEAAGASWVPIRLKAIGETVRLVELVLADHRQLLRKSDNARAMLDIFVQAGCAAAVQLVMRLDEALR